jgi:hypothetical protein
MDRHFPSRTFDGDRDTVMSAIIERDSISGIF